jgi:hypothetical protein
MRKPNRKINKLMLVQWLFFLVPMVFVGLLVGLFEGFFRVLQQAERDVFEG